MPHSAETVTASSDETARAARASCAPSVARVEVRRKLLHMIPGLVPLVLSPIPHRDPLSWIAKTIVLSVTTALTVLVFCMGRRVARDGERDWIGRVLAYPLVVVATLLLFSANAEFACVVVVVLAFGDGAATLGGVFWRTAPLPWNDSKTWGGFLAFLLCATPLAVLAYWLEAQPAVPVREAVCCAFAAALAGAVAESLRAKINDNFRVGVAAAVGVIVTHHLLFGPM